jgi:H/ACA ribonucleoprotein complex subunit 3
MKCPNCGKYTMGAVCPVCGSQTYCALPPRYSPNDRFQRFRLEKIEAKNDGKNNSQ